MHARLGFTLVFLTLSIGCPADTGPVDPAAQRGRDVYIANCIACHNIDPALPGPVGPEIKGSSRELIEARVLRGAYPSGYAPKRATTLMQPLPQLSGSIDDLAAFLN
jgi:mono/diheme cytochrome c family protein